MTTGPVPTFVKCWMIIIRVACSGRLLSRISEFSSVLWVLTCSLEVLREAENFK